MLRAGAVLDASCVLAFVLDEPGADRVHEALARHAAITTANWCEVLTKLADRGYDPQRMADVLLAPKGPLRKYMTIRPVTKTLALDAARIRRETRRSGISYGDRFCLALGRSLGLPVLTAERRWARLEVGVTVELIR